MQTIVKLALEAPFKLRMIQIAGMEFKVVSMHGNRGTLEGDDDFHALAFRARVEIEQRMLVKTELREDTIKAGVTGFRHQKIVEDCAATRSAALRSDPAARL